MDVTVRGEVVIEPRQQGKGRSFRAIYLASVSADGMWASGATDTGDVDRPIYASFLGSETELKPFVANLMLGRRALVPKNYGRRVNGMEFLKSAGYKFAWQREPEGAIVSVYLPDFFLMDPGMVDPKGAKFVLLPSTTWAAKQEIPTDAIVKHAKRLPLVKQLNAPPPPGDWRWRSGDYVHTPRLSDATLAEFVPTAYLFAAYLDRRTRAPLYADGRFYLQLLLACLNAGVATWGTKKYDRDSEFGQHSHFRYQEIGTTSAGFLPGIAFAAEHEALEELLAEEIATFFSITKGK